MEKYLMLTLILYKIYCTTNMTNLIRNGGFEDPQITTNRMYLCPTNWTCVHIQMSLQSVHSGMYGQFLDLVESRSVSISQSIYLESPATCKLSFALSKKNIYNRYDLNVVWNQIVVANYTNNNSMSSVVYINFDIQGQIGNNILKFQNGSASGSCSNIDNVSLSCYQPATNIATANVTTNTTTNTTTNAITNATTNVTTNVTTNATTNTTTNAITNATTNVTTNTTTNATTNTTTTNLMTNDLINSSNSIITTNFESFLPTQCVMAFSTILSLPINTISSVSTFLFFIEDLWLYNYDIRNYTGIVNTIFKTAQEIELVKFQLLGKYFEGIVHQLRSGFDFEGYVGWTSAQFFDKVGTTYVVADANFQYFVFTVPQTIVISWMLYLIYCKTKGKCETISNNVLIYRYTKSIILRALLQQNLAFFSYICLANMKCLFSYNPADKMFGVLAVMLFFIVVVYCCLFQFIIGRYVAGSGLFNKSVQASFAARCYLVVRYSGRAVIRGAIAYLLRELYEWQVAMLGIFEVFVAFTSFLIGIKYNIFKSKTTLIICISYHLFHGILNFCFLTESMSSRYQDIEMEAKSLKGQQVCICALAAICLLSILLNIIEKIYRKCRKFIQRKAEIQDISHKKQQIKQNQEIRLGCEQKGKVAPKSSVQACQKNIETFIKVDIKGTITLPKPKHTKIKYNKEQQKQRQQRLIVHRCSQIQAKKNDHPELQESQDNKY